MSQKLDQIRVDIDKTDEELVRLLQKRAELVLQVKATKEKENIQIYSPGREREIIQRIMNLGQGGSFPKESLERIFRSIVSATRSLIGELVVGYLGDEISVASKSARKQFGEDVNFVSTSSIEELFGKVKSGEIHYGVFPVEVSESGLDSRLVELSVSSALSIVTEVDLSGIDKSGSRRVFVVGRQSSSTN
jgi:chorismate mutase/prephenate dehydratase